MGKAHLLAKDSIPFFPGRSRPFFHSSYTKLLLRGFVFSIASIHVFVSFHFIFLENRCVKLRDGKNLVLFARKGDYVSSKWKYIGRYSAGRRTFKHGASMNIRLASRADTKSSSCRECKRFDSPLVRLEYSFEAGASIVVNLHDLSAWKNNKIIPLYMLLSV